MRSIIRACIVCSRALPLENRRVYYSLVVVGWACFVVPIEFSRPPTRHIYMYFVVHIHTYKYL